MYMYDSWCSLYHGNERQFDCRYFCFKVCSSDVLCISTSYIIRISCFAIFTLDALPTVMSEQKKRHHLKTLQFCKRFHIS